MSKKIITILTALAIIMSLMSFQAVKLGHRHSSKLMEKL